MPPVQNIATTGSAPPANSEARRARFGPREAPTTALLTDQYELTMLRSALQAGTAERHSVFELFGRRLPEGRRYGVVAGVGRALRALRQFRFDAETLTYLHSTVSTRRQRVRLPETPMHLDALLADEPLTGGLEPRLGDQNLRILTIIGFPTATTPGLLDDLNRLDDLAGTLALLTELGIV